MPRRILQTRYNLFIFATFEIVAVIGGVAVGIFVVRIGLFLSALAIGFSMVATSLAASRVLFTSVELDEGYVRLRAPLHQLTIARADVAAINLRLGSAWEDSKPLWKQVAMLEVFMIGGKRIVLGMLDVKTLRAIAAHLQGQAVPLGI